jgi:hypothetical protein
MKKLKVFMTCTALLLGITAAVAYESNNARTLTYYTSQTQCSGTTTTADPDCTASSGTFCYRVFNSVDQSCTAKYKP